MGYGQVIKQCSILSHSQCKNSGAALLYAIAALVLLSSLAVGIAVISPAASQTNLADNRKARASYLAQSGLNAWTIGRTGTFAVGNDSVTLSQGNRSQGLDNF